MLTGGDTGQSEPATVLQMSTTSSGVGKTLGDAAGEGDKVKHPVGYLKEQPPVERAGTAAEVAGLFFQCQAWPGSLYR